MTFRRAEIYLNHLGPRRPHCVSVLGTRVARSVTHGRGGAGTRGPRSGGRGKGPGLRVLFGDAARGRLGRQGAPSPGCI